MKRYLKYITAYAAMGLLAPTICILVFKIIDDGSFSSVINNKTVIAVMLGFSMFGSIFLGSLSYSNVRDDEKQKEIRKMFLVDMAYRNYKGEHGTYLIYPLDVRFGSNDFHKTPQWMLIADKYNPNDLSEPPKRRTFAMQDITKIGDIVNKDYK